MKVGATLAKQGSSVWGKMSVLFVAIPIALVISAIAVIAFVNQVRSGQFDDLETPPRRMLFDDAEVTSKKN